MAEGEDTKPTAAAASAVEISPETSTRVCKHMNEDHALSVYGMAINTLTLAEGWKLTDAKMKKVTADACHLNAVTCSGDLCEMKVVEYPFVPPLSSASQLKARLVAIHHQVLSPQWMWIYTKPFALKLFATFAIISYGTLVMGGDGMIKHFDETQLIKSWYPHTDWIALAIQGVFYVTAVAHVAEAAYAGYVCRTDLKLNWMGTLQWIAMVFFVGFPILNELTALLKYLQHKKKEATVEDTGKKEL